MLSRPACLICGIDPGLSGTIAFVDAASGAVVNVTELPVLQLARGGKNKRDLDAHALARLISNRRPGHTFVELVGAMPGQGVSSVFAFGKSFGVVIGVLAALGIPYTLVAPVVWKRALSVPVAKDGARARASQLMPAAAHHWTRVRDDGRAEAALLGLYGLRSLQQVAA
jgi:crossover junction endodeoxyribonuclease RuvC